MNLKRISLWVVAFCLPLLTSCKTYIALGDSTTRAANVQSGCGSVGGQLLPECGQYSWATGSQFNSQFNLINAIPGNPQQGGVNWLNQAVTGSISSNLLSQFNAASQAMGSSVSPDYVTIESGANDFCNQNAGVAWQVYNNVANVITQIAYNRAQIRNKAGTNAFYKTNKALIYVAPIPNLVKLKRTMLASPRAGTCQAQWNGNGVPWGLPYCPTYLRSGAPISDNQMAEGIAQANGMLAYLPTAFANNSDVVVTFGYQLNNFSNNLLNPNHVSTVDCFHPSVAAQQAISAYAWAEGWATKNSRR